MQRLMSIVGATCVALACGTNVCILYSNYFIKLNDGGMSDMCAVRIFGMGSSVCREVEVVIYRQQFDCMYYLTQ